MDWSNEKTIINLLIIPITVTLILCAVFAPQIQAYSNPTIKIPPESLCICVSPANIKLNDGYYNVSVTLVNTGATDAQLQKFYVDRFEDTLPLNRTIPGMALYFNGTAVNPSQLDVNLKIGDNLQASFLLPRAEYVPNTNMSLTVYTSQDMYWSEFPLNWIP